MKTGLTSDRIYNIVSISSGIFAVLILCAYMITYYIDLTPSFNFDVFILLDGISIFIGLFFSVKQIIRSKKTIIYFALCLSIISLIGLIAFSIIII